MLLINLLNPTVFLGAVTYCHDYSENAANDILTVHFSIAEISNP